MRTAVIMQPTYLPWMGYFDLMDQSDVFVLLDSVQFDKRSWQQRNRIKTPSGELLLTEPVFSKGKCDQKICEVQIDQTSNFAEKHIRAIQHNYSKAPCFGKYIDELTAILRKRHQYLAELNIELINWLRGVIGVETELVRNSSLGVQGKKVDLLVAICKAVGAEHYLSPLGSKAYIEENNIFAQNNIELEYQNFEHPVYKQLHGDFIAYLSVIDLLFNEGECSLEIIKSGRVNEKQVI